MSDKLFPKTVKALQRLQQQFNCKSWCDFKIYNSIKKGGYNLVEIRLPNKFSALYLQKMSSKV